MKIVFIVLILSLACSAFDDDEFAQAPHITLEHELTKGRFTKRGSVAFHSIGSSGAAQYNGDGELSDADKVALLKLAENNDIYRVRAPTKSGQQFDFVYGFVYACDLVRAGLRDNVTLALNAHGGLVGVHVALREQTAARYEACRLTEAERLPAALPRSFATRASVSRPATGPMPETQLYVAKMEEEKKRKQAAEQGDNRSFLGKYWMYILPVVVLFMVASNGDPNAQGGS